MKMHTMLLLGLGLACGALGARAQGNFQNLGFESATIVHAPGYPADTFLFAAAFPGWASYVGADPNALTIYNDLFMSTAGISLIDIAYQPIYGWHSPGGLIQGNYTAVLMSGDIRLGQSASATMVQTGLVPLGTKSLQFRAHFDPYNSSGSFGAALGGQTLSLVPLQAGSNHILCGADVQGWAGQTAELTFTVFAYPQQTTADYRFRDSIQFSDQAIPEPGVLALSASGALLLVRQALG